MSGRTSLCGILLTTWLILSCLFTTTTALADAASARQQINATVTEIGQRVAEIKSLKSAKKLSQAFDKLADLNRFIQSNLGDVFYDRVQDVLREEPSYTPPVVDIDLGVEFTVEYWDQKVAVAESSLKNATESLKGIPAMAALDYQDKAWVWLKATKDTVESIGNIYKDIATLDFFGLFKDGYEGVNGFIENMTAVENANLKDLERELFRVQVNKLISKAKKNLELMKDAKSAMLVYRMEIIGLQYNLRNIARYTTSASQNPVWPLDFNNADYNFDPTPYTQAIDRLLGDFLAGEFCWDKFVRMYDSIRAEALAEKNQIEANINNSSEPPQNKTVYLNDLAINWDYFDNYATTRYSAQHDVRLLVLAEHNSLLAEVDALRTQRQALADDFWDTTGFAREDLETFDEQADGIVQTNMPDFSGESPYFLGREYAPSFPLFPAFYSTEMPAQAPDITAYSYNTYGEGLIRLAAAYRNMAEAALMATSTKIYQGSGRPVATFAQSPLSLDHMNVVETNLITLKTQVSNFTSHMDIKRDLIPDLEAGQDELIAAENALVAHARDNWIYLCEDPDGLATDADRTWDDIFIPILLAAMDADAGAYTAEEAIDAHLDYIAGQEYANQQIDLSTSLIARMQSDAELRAVVNFTVSDYTVLPAMPSEQGYLDFLTQLRWIDAFYALADLNRVMDLRQDARDIFRRIYADAGNFNQWLRPENPFCVMPESVAAFNALIDQTGLWSDQHMTAVRQGFPGWDDFAREQLALHWPAGNTDDIRPNVIHFTPGRNSEMVSLYQVIRVTFNETMNPDTLKAPNIAFTANDTPRPMNPRYDKATNTLSIDPGRMLPGTVYTLAFTEGCTDLSGNTLVPESWSFTTMAMPEDAPAGAAIDLSGVADGGSYPDPVTLAIQATDSYTATLSVNGEAAGPVVSGTTLTRRGSYVLTVTTDSGLVRTATFTIGTMPENVEVATANFFETPARPRAMNSADRVGAGLRYFVDGNRYYYMLNGTVYLFDMLTGQDTRLFDAGYYYQSTGGVNVAPSTYCSFLGASGDRVLYVKNTGAEGPGVSPETKTFNLFVYDLATGRTTALPLPEGVSVTSGRIAGRAVAWMEPHNGTSAIYRWDMDTGEVLSVADFSELETWQVPELMGFDGEWVLYKIGDGNKYTIVKSGDMMTRTPRGESLLAKNPATGMIRTVVARDPARPVRVKDADLVAGRSAYLTYESSGINPPDYWEDTCTASRLSLMHLASGMVRLVSEKPLVRDFQMSGSLLYFTDRVSAPPYSLTAVVTLDQSLFTVTDLFTYRSTVASFDISYYHYGLFGDRLVSDHDTPRVIRYASAASTVTMVEKAPAPDAADVPADARVTASFSAPLDPFTLTGEYMALSRIDAGGTFIERVPVDISYDPATNTVTLDPSGLVSGARYRVVFAGGFLDADGNTVTAPAMWYFTATDTTGPVLAGSSPETGCACMAPAAGIVLRFNEPVDNATAAAGIRLLSGLEPVCFTSYAGVDGTLTITPDVPLDQDTQYTVNVLAGLTDTAGNPAEPSSFTFTTTAPGADVPPGAVYRSDAMMGGIYQIDLPELTTTQVGADMAMNITPSPDGSVVFLNTMIQSLVALDIASGNTTTLADNVPYGQTPVFSPDGETVYYSHQRDGYVNHDVIASSLSGDAAHVVRDFPSGTVSSLALSPDGSALAFSHAEGFTAPSLYVMTLSSSHEASVADATLPVWSRDGQRLLAFAKTSATEYRNALVEFTPDLAPIRVVREMETPQAAALSPAGNHLAVFLSTGIYLVDLGTGDMRQTLACGQANMQSAVRLFWTRDGVSLVFNATGVTGSWDPGVYVLDVAAGKTATLFTVEGGMPGMPMGFFEAPSPAVLPQPVTPVVTDQSTDAAVSVHIDWSSYTDSANASEYRVYRAEAPFASVRDLVPLSTTSQQTFTDTTAVRGTACYYAVTPVSPAGSERQLVSLAGPVAPGDGDTLDNAWEMHWFGSLAADPAADTDQDGLDNQAEQREGTDPTSADTDGDGAADGAEVTRGFNPLVNDVQPLLLSAAGPDVVVSETLTLSTSGGSGFYTWSTDGAGQATVSPAGVLTGASAGPLTITARDSIFPDLVSNPVTVNVLAEPFGIRPGSPVALQIDGYVRLTAPGGSGFYEWQLSPDAPADLQESGAGCLVSATEPVGTFDITVTDLLVPERIPAAATLIIQAIPGDITGDSMVGLDDAVLGLKIPTMPAPADMVNPNGDADGDSRVDFRESLYILRKIER